VKPTLCLIFIIATLVLLTSCGQTTQIATVTVENGQTPEIVPTLIESTLTPTPRKTLIITDTQDSGAGSLRQALLDIQPDDSIFFDTDVFPPDKPQTIILQSSLPPVNQGHLVLDASNAGVILDGSQAGGNATPGLDIDSSYNVVRGLQITGFSGPGIILRANADFNIIGGDRSMGMAPYGEGNLIRNCVNGITLQGSDNIIQGNLIGTDKTGQKKWGNKAAGIFLKENANRNVIGPGNVIAYNGAKGSGGGINIQSENIYANHITRNNIHDNAQPAIFYELWQDTGPLKNPRPPILLEFNLPQGFVSGLACPNCTVEFFTTSRTEGEIFEGNVIASPDGTFNFEKEGGFLGVQLKATAYSENQNNSEFSEYTDSYAQSINLQTGNENPRLALPMKAFKDLPFNGIGITQHLDCTDEQSVSNYLSAAEYMGYKWMRVNFDWYDWPDVRRTGKYSDFNITPCQEKIIDLLHQNDIQILYNIVYWDSQPPVSDLLYTRFRTNEEVQRYVDYVHFIVGHFKGRVQSYSILNEPNLPNEESAVRVGDYINLLRAVIPTIRETDPQANIIVGEVTSLNEARALDYLRAILKSDILLQVDGLAWHSSGGNAPEYQADFYLNYPNMVREIIATSRIKGFTGQLFKTELEWPGFKNFQPKQSNWAYTNPSSAKYYARSIVFHHAKNILVTVDSDGYASIPQVVRGIRSLTNLLAGAQPMEIPIKFKQPLIELRSAAFRLPDGSQLIAIWRDVFARDDDTGVINAITFPASKAKKVTGIDPLYAYQQELVFSQTNNGLLISNFLVKDYPTFIHLSAP
jgi:hypothetical protein